MEGRGRNGRIGRERRDREKGEKKRRRKIEDRKYERWRVRGKEKK